MPSKKILPTAATVASYRSQPQPYSNYLRNLAALAVQLQNLKDASWDLTEEVCEHYVYVYLDPRKPGSYEYTCPSGKVVRFKFKPFYVGKGKGGRIDAHLDEAKGGATNHKLRTICAIRREAGRDPIRIRTASVSTEWMAFALEIDLIAGIGRHNTKTGPLTNLTDGGEGSSGLVATAESRRKRSEKNKGQVRSTEALAQSVATRKRRGSYNWSAENPRENANSRVE